jgi:hypothetical protein
VHSRLLGRQRLTLTLTVGSGKVTTGCVSSAAGTLRDFGGLDVFTSQKLRCMHLSGRGREQTAGRMLLCATMQHSAGLAASEGDERVNFHRRTRCKSIKPFAAPGGFDDTSAWNAQAPLSLLVQSVVPGRNGSVV